MFGLFLAQHDVCLSLVVALSFYMKDGIGIFLTVIFSVFPWSLLVKGFNDLGLATQEGNRGARENCVCTPFLCMCVKKAIEVRGRIVCAYCVCRNVCAKSRSLRVKR
jgi:hypothetical protein